MIFIDRKRELKSLKERLTSPNFELIIIYGRRRIGKTSVALEAIKDLDDISLYYLATQKNNLPKFKEVAERKFPELRYVKEDWEALFHFLKDKIIIIDEFPYIIEEDKSVLSIFQKIVDQLKHTRTKILLIGSSISLMEDAIAYKSPLYGRRTASLELREVNYSALTDGASPPHDEDFLLPRGNLLYTPS